MSHSQHYSSVSCKLLNYTHTKVMYHLFSFAYIVQIYSAVLSSHISPFGTYTLRVRTHYGCGTDALRLRTCPHAATNGRTSLPLMSLFLRHTRAGEGMASAARHARCIRSVWPHPKVSFSNTLQQVYVMFLECGKKPGNPPNVSTYKPHPDVDFGWIANLGHQDKSANH